MWHLLKFCALFVLLTAGSSEGAAADSWWKTASIYQIYPRSFKDSDGDGIGDLKGITQQLAHLKEIGIDATWISPIFTSPMADFGYDIANFTEVDPMFGTMDDFKALVAKANSLGVEVILDFVPNHSSDECEWFIKSAQGDPEYKDFYVWHEGKILENGTRVPPTNWVSVFRGSSWTWNDERQAYYLHQFHAKQPDLNYRNPKVVDAMKDVFRYWVRLGVAGFRVDAVPYIFEIAADEDGNWPDEPVDPSNGVVGHIYTQNQPETVDMIYQFREVMKEMDEELGGNEHILLIEAYTSLEILMQFYGNDTVEGAQIPFNFVMMSGVTETSKASDYARFINNWIESLPEGGVANWVMGNHDTSRIATRLGSVRIDLINILMKTLPGVSITYQGEEIGMTDVEISWENTVDPQGCQSSPEEYVGLSRDPERTPFQWSDEYQAGFTEGSTTWLPVADNYKQVNVKNERRIALSHLNIYKQLQKLRFTKTMSEGQTEVKALNENVLGIKRYLAGERTFVVLLNFGDGLESIDLSATFSDLTTNLEYVLVTDKGVKRKGDEINASSIELLPNEGTIMRTVV